MKKIIGYYRTLMVFPDGFGKTKCFGKREIPSHIKNRAPLGQTKGCIQVLIKSVGKGYQWINIPGADFTAA